MSLARPKSKPGLFRLAYHRFFGGSQAEVNREYDREFDREPPTRRERRPNTSRFTQTYTVTGHFPGPITLVVPRNEGRR